MTEEQKDILISRMLECPGELSDSEITQILADEELRDIYDLSLDLKTAKGKQPEIDARTEWRRFRPILAVGNNRIWVKWIASIAAVFIGVLTITAVFVRSVDELQDTGQSSFANNSRNHQKVTNVSPAVSNDTPKADEQTISVPNKSIPAKTFRISPTGIEDDEQEEPIDAEEYLRVQQARIDNELAMQNAENMISLYYAFMDSDPNISDMFSEEMPYDEGNTIHTDLSTFIMP